MEIKCDNCSAKLNIPDEKIPQGRQVSIVCPKCKQKLTLGVPAPKTERPVPAVEETLSTKTVDAGSSFEFYEEGVKLGLVAASDSDQLKKLKQVVEELGYKYVPVENTSDAISKMRFHTFDLVVLSDQFDGIELAQSPILQYMNHLSMFIRRRMFVALVGDSFNTMDQMMAFSMSANLVINSREMDNLTNIMKGSIADNEKFYKVFFDTLLEVGKA